MTEKKRRLQDYLMDSGDELDGSLTLTERNLETLFGADGIMETKKEPIEAGRTSRNAESPRRVGEYISAEDYTKKSSAISRQLEASGKFIDEFAKMLQLYQGNTDPEAVRKYEQAQAGYNRNLELQSELQKMMDTLGSNRDYSAQAEEANKSDKFFDNDVDAARAFAEEAIPLTDQNNKEYAAIMTVEWVPENRNGEIYMVPKYTYGTVIEGEHNNVVDIALAGLLVPTEGKKYLLHTHTDSEYSIQKKYDVPDEFSGAPGNILDPGDANIPTVAGSDWNELPQLLNNSLQNSSLGTMELMGVEIRGYDGIYLCSPTGKLYYYEGTGTGDYQTSNKDDFKTYRDDFEKADDFPRTTRHWDVDTNTYILKEK